MADFRICSTWINCLYIDLWSPLGHTSSPAATVLAMVNMFFVACVVSCGVVPRRQVLVPGNNIHLVLHYSNGLAWTCSQVISSPSLQYCSRFLPISCCCTLNRQRQDEAALEYSQRVLHTSRELWGVSRAQTHTSANYEQSINGQRRELGEINTVPLLFVGSG